MGPWASAHGAAPQQWLDTHTRHCARIMHAKNFQSNPSTPKACNSKAQAAAWKNDPTGELRPVGPCGIRAIAFAPQAAPLGFRVAPPSGLTRHRVPRWRHGADGR